LVFYKADDFAVRAPDIGALEAGKRVAHFAPRP